MAQFHKETGFRMNVYLSETMSMEPMHKAKAHKRKEDASTSAGPLGLQAVKHLSLILLSCKPRSLAALFSVAECLSILLSFESGGPPNLL